MAEVDRKLNLLLVDDRPENILALEGLLGDLGQNLHTATSGQEALKRLLQDEYALVLLDVQMPGMDGFETAQLIRQRQKTQHVPIIFITAINQSEANIAQGYAVGAVDYLLKPVSPEILKAKVSAFVRLAHRQTALREQEVMLAVLDTLLMAAPVSLAFMDKELRYLRVNSRAAASAGRPAEEMIGRTIWEVIPHLAPQVAPYYQQVLETGQPLLGLEVSGETDAAPGAQRHFLVNYHPVLTRSGEMLGIGVTALDITEFKQTEAALRRANAASEAYLAMLGHELRNPLAAITTSSYLLNQSTLDGPHTERHLAVIHRQAMHLTRMVDDLLDVARITHGKLSLRRERLDLRQVVREVAEDTAALLDARDHSLTLVLAPEPLWVEGDPMRLTQVLTNLWTNAAKYTDPGGELCVTAAQEAREVVLRVQDNGIGILPEVLSHIFEPFFQAEQPLDRSLGGLGIGLSAAQQLVEMHGGTLQAFSTGEGCGSEFVVRLPALLEPDLGEATGD